MLELSNQFMELFRGSEVAHGEFVTQKSEGKVKGRARTVKSGATLELWSAHFLGNTGLGIIPIKQNNTCHWGAVDIDDYSISIEDLSQKLPDGVFACRTKSGGVHLYLFVRPAAPASMIRKKLLMVARAVGYPDAELFPKQNEVGSDGVGNWINMPYFGADQSTRYCVYKGSVLSPKEFADLANEHKFTLDKLVDFKMESVLEADDDEFIDAPPCIRRLVANGVPSGTKNNALFSMGVYAKKKFGVGWEDKVFEYNQRFMSGTYSEVAAIIRSLSKRTYHYKCKDVPLNGICDKVACMETPFGIEVRESDEKGLRPCVLDEVDEVICYEPEVGSKNEPYWMFRLGDRELDVTIDMIRSQTVFAREYLRECKRVILPVKESRWVKKMNSLLEQAEVRQLAPDAGPEGQFWGHVEEFCTGRAKAKAKDEVILGKPFHENGRVYFRSGDLIQYLLQQKFRSFTEREIWAILRRNGADHATWRVKGKTLCIWSIDGFPEQTEGFEFTPVPEDESNY